MNSKLQYTEAEKIEILQSLIDSINQHNIQIEFVISTYHNFDSLNEPIQELVRVLAKQNDISDRTQLKFYCITRFVRSGRIRVFYDFDEAYYTLMGMCTLYSELDGNDPLIAIKDGLLK